MPLIAWARYHLIGRNKRARTLNVILVSFSLCFLITRIGQRRRSSQLVSPTFTWPLFDFISTDGMLRNSKVRTLPMTDSSLSADWIYSTVNGSFWLPRPPSNPISGFESRMGGNTFLTDVYKGQSGFVHPDKIDILMAQGTGFNAGDFYALWIAPMVSGRKANLPNPRHHVDRCSLAVVGSILEWGVRYVWGPGFISSDKTLAKETETVFALRGPQSYKMARETSTDASQAVSPIYGDPGLLMSWYYQPYNQTKSYSLCLIPHYSESRASQLVDIATKWKGTVHQIDIMMKNIFHIMDDIVKCEFVLSSSLHGIIFSDSYSIPNAHMNLTGRVTGGSYKFDDYFASVNRTRTTLELVDRTSVGMAEVEVVMAKSQQLSNINILPLWENAPMHAQAYNRSRQEHLDFARDYAKKFTDTLNNNPINLKAFLDQMGIEH